MGGVQKPFKQHPRGKLKVVRLFEARQFDSEFYRDIAISGGVFVLTLIGAAYGIPGGPFLLMVGPMAGIILCFMHRNPR